MCTYNYCCFAVVIVIVQRFALVAVTNYHNSRRHRDRLFTDDNKYTTILNTIIIVRLDDAGPIIVSVIFLVAAADAA